MARAETLIACLALIASVLLPRVSPHAFGNTVVNADFERPLRPGANARVSIWKTPVPTSSLGNPASWRKQIFRILLLAMNLPFSR